MLVPRVNNGKKRWGWCYNAKYKIIRYQIITNLMTSHLFLDPQFSSPHFCFWVAICPIYRYLLAGMNLLSVSQLLSHWFRISQLDCGHFRDFCFYPGLSFRTYLLTKYGLCDPAPHKCNLQHPQETCYDPCCQLLAFQHKKRPFFSNFFLKNPPSHPPSAPFDPPSGSKEILEFW